MTHCYYFSITLAQYLPFQLYCHSFEASPWPIKSRKGRFRYVVWKKNLEANLFLTSDERKIDDNKFSTTNISNTESDFRTWF